MTEDENENEDILNCDLFESQRTWVLACEDGEAEETESLVNKLNQKERVMKDTLPTTANTKDEDLFHHVDYQAWKTAFEDRWCLIHATPKKKAYFLCTEWNEKQKKFPTKTIHEMKGMFTESITLFKGKKRKRVAHFCILIWLTQDKEKRTYEDAAQFISPFRHPPNDKIFNLWHEDLKTPVHHFLEEFVAEHHRNNVTTQTLTGSGMLVFYRDWCEKNKVTNAYKDSSNLVRAIVELCKPIPGAINDGKRTNKNASKTYNISLLFAFLCHNHHEKMGGG